MVPDNFRALALDKQKLTGLLGSRIRANSEGFLENVDVTELLRPLQAEKDSNGVERNFPGQFLDAAADAFEYNHDLQLRAQMDKVASAIASSAKTVVPDPDNRFSGANLGSSRSDLLGLLAYYRVTGQPTALSTAQTMASSLIDRPDSTANEKASSEKSRAMAQAGLIEPLLQLYRRSGDRKYIEFCTRLARAVTIPEITSATPQSTLVSTFSALGGLAELYEATGDASFLQPGIAAWKHLVAIGRISVTGSPLPPGGEASTFDACTSASWLQLTFKLLRITGEATYGDQLERSIFNQILASQDGRTGNISPEAPLNGAKTFSGKLAGRSGSCMLSEAKALASIPRFVWGRYENGIAVNLYTPGRAFFTLRKHGQVQIYSEADFPQTGQLQLHVEPSKKVAQFPLRLRVPSWTDKFDVEVADLRLQGRAGEVVVIDREWKSGDTVRVSMRLPLSISRAMSNGAGATSIQSFILRRGPQILALSKVLNPELQDLTTALVRQLPSGHFQISNYNGRSLPREFSGDQVYRIDGEVLGKKQELLLAPFADAIDYRTELTAKPNESSAK